MNGEDVATEVAERLGDRTIATAESCTAGRIAETLAAVPGAADFLRGGVVAYQEETKRRLLGVTVESVYCEEAAAEMAAGALALFQADVAVATSGVAGGDPVDGVEPGTVFVGIALEGETTATTHRFDGSADEVVDQARRRALDDLRARLTATRTATP